MKILLVASALGAVYGGPTRIALDFAAALGRLGWQADLVATDANGPERLDVPCERWIAQDGYRLQYFPRRGCGEYKLSWPLLAWLLRHAGEYDAAHLTLNFNFPMLAAALACRLRRVPYVVAPQGTLEPWALAHKAGKKAPYFRLVERPLVLRGARLIQALNGVEAANLAALRLGPRTFVLPNGIAAADARPADPADVRLLLERFPALRGKRLILFLHRVDPKKGLDLLAPALAAARRRFPDAHAIVAGPAAAGFEAAAQGYFEAAGVGGAATFTGMLSGALKRGALAAAEVFVAPTRSEGFSMSVLEAMAAGLPCVLTTGCNFPEAGETGAARITPIEAGAFGVALIDALADPAASRAMGVRARKLVLANYTWDGIAARFTTLAPAWMGA